LCVLNQAARKRKSDDDDDNEDEAEDTKREYYPPCPSPWSKAIFYWQAHERTDKVTATLKKRSPKKTEPVTKTGQLHIFELDTSLELGQDVVTDIKT
jgi:hypothetical protein